MPFVTFFDFGGYMLFHQLLLHGRGFDLYEPGEEDERDEGPAVNAADLAPAENKTGRKVAGAKRVAKAHEKKVKNSEEQEKNADKGEASKDGERRDSERREDAMSIGA
ncbi:hypothetical protein BDZ89DRAFT_1073458 [Hymenopellis radicata]|nr:hypothetical protein BDZ89DRAFT_1073458 [Hymenopellis radicata]